MRLLVLNSSVGESDQWGCRLDVKPLSSDYRALLYAWRGECDTVPMLVNGLQFEVTRNLAAPLRHIPFLMVTNETILWVDAVCINRGTTSERVLSSNKCVTFLQELSRP